MYIDQPLIKYLDDTASGKPTPGGGSVSGLVGALSAALTSMVCNFTIGKEKYKEFEKEVSEILSEVQGIRDELTALMEQDIKAYGEVSLAYSMPRATEEEKQRRALAIQSALINAKDAPLKIAMLCHRILELNVPLLEKGNQNLISDVGISALLAGSALRSAVLNVEINLSYIKDEQLKSRTREQLRPIVTSANELETKIYEEVKRRIGAQL